MNNRCQAVWKSCRAHAICHRFRLDPQRLPLLLRRCRAMPMLAKAIRRQRRHAYRPTRRAVLRTPWSGTFTKKVKVPRLLGGLAVRLRGVGNDRRALAATDETLARSVGRNGHPVHQVARLSQSLCHPAQERRSLYGVHTQHLRVRAPPPLVDNSGAMGTATCSQWISSSGRRTKSALPGLPLPLRREQPHPKLTARTPLRSRSQRQRQTQGADRGVKDQAARTVWATVVLT